MAYTKIARTNTHFLTWFSCFFALHIRGQKKREENLIVFQFLCEKEIAWIQPYVRYTQTSSFLCSPCFSSLTHAYTHIATQNRMRNFCWRNVCRFVSSFLRMFRPFSFLHNRARASTHEDRLIDVKAVSVYLTFLAVCGCVCGKRANDESDGKHIMVI